jgi:hypothetical protein
MHRVRERWASVTFLTGIVLVMTALPAGAKMPPRTCELSTTRPVVGEPVTVEVRYWWDAEHTERAPMAIFRKLHLVAVAVDRGQPGEYELGVIPAVLPRVSRSAYRGEIILPDTRRFRMRDCGGGYDRRGYPLRRGVLIAPREALGGRASGASIVGLAVGVLIAGLGAATVIATRARRRSAAVRRSSARG